MSRKMALIYHLLFFCLLTLAANCYMLIKANWMWVLLAIPSFLAVNIFAGFYNKDIPTKRLKVCNHGVVSLCLFLVSSVISIVYHIFLAFKILPDGYLHLIFSIVVCIIVQAIMFWNGIICVYITSVQLAIKHRVIGVLLGFIPIAHLFALSSIIRIVLAEVKLETDKAKLNSERASQQVCKTKYPLLLVHGVFFRDTKYFNYWGRVPKELEKNGATVYYGEHQSAASVADSAKELAERIKKIVSETGCEKVNIIAHSKGGLDCRYALSHTDAAEHVASLTTINTPHRGCLFADYLLKYIPSKVKDTAAAGYNTALKKLGDKEPDFLSAVNDLTAESCERLDSQLQAPEGIYCQSVGSVMKKASNGQFPLNYSYHLVKLFGGKNDGLVAEHSFKWGEKYTLLTPKGDRGISHGDMIDLNREDVYGFDVREFYVQLVSDLKNRGL